MYCKRAEDDGMEKRVYPAKPCVSWSPATSTKSRRQRAKSSAIDKCRYFNSRLPHELGSGEDRLLRIGACS